MSLEKVIIEDKIEIVVIKDNLKAVQVRTRTSIREDGKELSSSFHRHTINPGDDLTNESDEVKNICESIFTEQMIADYISFSQTPPNLEEEYDSGDTTDSDSD